MTAMPCPVCGISEGLCDCLLRSARGNATDSTAVPGPAPSGVPAGGPPDADEPGGFNGQAGSGTLVAAAGSEWADSLLQFVRDFASASPRAVPAPTGHPGRNQPVGRDTQGSGVAHQGTPGHQEPAAAAVDGTSVPGPAVAATEAGSEPPASSAGSVRVAPFVRFESARGDQPASPSRPAPVAPRSGAPDRRVVRGRVRMAAGCRRRSLGVEAHLAVVI